MRVIKPFQALKLKLVKKETVESPIAQDDRQARIYYIYRIDSK